MPDPTCQQTPPDLPRAVAINKDLARLAPVVEAFEQLSKLQQARFASRAVTRCWLLSHSG